MAERKVARNLMSKKEMERRSRDDGGNKSTCLEVSVEKDNSQRSVNG